MATVAKPWHGGKYLAKYISHFADAELDYFASDEFGSNLRRLEDLAASLASETCHVTDVTSTSTQTQLSQSQLKMYKFIQPNMLEEVGRVPHGVDIAIPSELQYTHPPPDVLIQSDVLVPGKITDDKNQGQAPRGKGAGDALPIHSPTDLIYAEVSPQLQADVIHEGEPCDKCSCVICKGRASMIMSDPVIANLAETYGRLTKQVPCTRCDRELACVINTKQLSAVPCMFCDRFVKSVVVAECFYCENARACVTCLHAWSKHLRLS
jgi:hypothetical protein